MTALSRRWCWPGRRRWRWRWRGPWRGGEFCGAPEGPDPDVAILHVAARIFAAACTGIARRRVTRATRGARAGAARRHHTVEPLHVRSFVVPERQGQDHAALEGRAHLLQATSGRECVLIPRLCLLSTAEATGDGIMRLLLNSEIWCVNSLPTLHVKTANLCKVARVGVVISNKLRNNSERLRSVHVEAWAFTEELFVAEAVGVQVTAASVAKAISPAIFLVFATFGSYKGTGVSRVCGCLGVCLPNIHLSTA